MKPSNALFASLSSTITEITRLSGIAGVSVGVIDNGQIIHQASYGFCDVESQSTCDSESTFVLGSLSKAFTSTLLGHLVEEGRLNWDDPLSQILPEFQRGSDDLSRHTTIADLLSHHTGLSAFDSLWLGSNNVPLLNHDDAVDILSYVPQGGAFRSSFIYNNFAYEVLGHVIEKVSGSTYSSFLRERLLEPLGMKRTYYTDAEGIRNEAKPYAALKNASVVQIPPALKGKDVLMGPAGGIRSCVDDLLNFYDALMGSAAEQLEISTTANNSRQSQKPSLPGLAAMWTGWNILPMPLFREHSYGYGWLRSQLPSVLAPSRGNPELSPLIGIGAGSRLAIWHSGDIPGYQTHATLFPETNQAVVVLTNSMTLNAGSRYISDLLIEALFDNLDNAHDYARLARISATLGSTRMDGIHKRLLDGRTRSKPLKPLNAYAGKYYNTAKNFFIDILESEDDVLYVSFVGREEDTFKLEPYRDNSFFWFLDHDAAARLARYDGYGEEFYVVKFGNTNDKNEVLDTLWWKHEGSLGGCGEAFKRQTKQEETAADEDIAEL